jgi:REP element-mobilizing transposase RayT
VALEEAGLAGTTLFKWEVWRLENVLWGMGRRIRFLPSGCHVVEITNRTIGRHLLLAPSKRLREITLGALGRAQRIYGVQIHAFVFLSNHYHLLISVDDVRQMASFVGYFESKLAREAARAIGWDDVVWSHPYHAAVVSNEEAAQVARLDYILSNGVKEHLVSHPCDWPGATSARALLEGKPLRGVWHDRTGSYRARVGGRPYRAADFEQAETVKLTPLPCWEGESPAVLRERVRERVEGIVAGVRRDPERFRAILRRVRPTDRPQPAKWTPAPWFHCASRTMRLRLKEAYSEFLAAYRHAARALQDGELTAPFPEGCFPPPRPFVAVG